MKKSKLKELLANEYLKSQGLEQAIAQISQAQAKQEQKIAE